MTNKQSGYNNDFLNFDDEIDIIQIYNFFCRNKKFIITTSLIGLVFGIIVSFSMKRIWQGSFQIVLSTPQEPQSPQQKLRNELMQSTRLNLSQLALKNNKLLTEVEILKSPSILMPVFDLYKNQSKLIQNNDNLRFENWKSNIKVELKKGTSVLTLKYKNKNKEIILPVLQSISEEYQKYSRRDRIKALEKGLNYLDEQTKIYKSKSLKSFRDAREFALENNLNPNLSIISFTDPNPDKFVDKDIISINNRISFLKNKKNNLEKINDGSIIQFAETIPELKTDKLYLKLKDVEDSLINRLVYYTEEDNGVKTLRKKKSEMISNFKIAIDSLLTSKINNEEAILKSLQRPNEIIIKYNQMRRNANRDEFILRSLEDNMRFLALEQAKSKDPWELISIPTMDELPAGPQRKLITLFTAIIGFVIGLILRFSYEKRTNLIYSSEKLRRIIPYRFLDVFSLSIKETWESKVQNISKICKLELNNEKISIYPLIEDSFQDQKLILSYFNKYSDIFDINNSKNSKLILIVGLGMTKNEKLIKFLRDSELLKKEIFGWIQLNTKYTL